MVRPWRALLGSFAAVLLLGVVARGEDKTEDPLAVPAGTEVTSYRYTGKPFGVCRLTVNYPADQCLFLRRDQLPRITEADGRIFYPACRRSVHADGGLRSLEIHFLFVGDDPLHVTVHALGSSEHKIEVELASNKRHKLLGDWWEAYLLPRDPRLQSHSSNTVRDYLESMLARRLKPPPRGREASFEEHEAPDGSQMLSEVLSYLTGTTSIRGAMQNQRLLSPAAPGEIANLPFPKAAAPPPVALPEKLRTGVTVEPIALRVPAECFYVRCRHFADYLWLRDLVDGWGGSVDQFVALESLTYDVRRGVERRLGLAVTDDIQASLDQAIDDFAIIGTDLFFREGPSVGLLLQAKDEALLAGLIRNQRKAILAEQGAAERTVSLGDDKAQLLTTADGRVSSYYAVSGKYHLVATSSYITRRFFAASRGEDSLAGLEEFRYARQKMPLARNDDAFIYLSDPFFRMLVGPQYRVEMSRRAAAAGELQQLELARLAAGSEKSDATSVAALEKAGFLAVATARPDGSAAEISGGQVRDSLRGVAGAFVPIPDVEIQGLTRSESDEYQEFARWYRGQWERLDPVILAIDRRPAGMPQRETVALDFVITPYLRSQYAGLNNLWADRSRLSLEDSALITAEVGLRDLLGEEPQTIFGGVEDVDLPYHIERGELKWDFEAHRLLFWWNPPLEWFKQPFLGMRTASKEALSDAWLGNLARDMFGQPDRDGYAERAKSGDESSDAYFGSFQSARFDEKQIVLAEKRADLERIMRGWKVVPAQRPAQLRLNVKDISGTRLGQTIDAAGYLQARRVSAANAYLLRLFDQQLHVTANDMPQAAVGAVGGRLRCPLGGEYSLGSGDRPALWRSSAWPTTSIDQIDRIPEGYQFPFTQWLHGLNLEFSLDETTLRTHVEFEVDRR